MLTLEARGSGKSNVDFPNVYLGWYRCISGSRNMQCSIPWYDIGKHSLLETGVSTLDLDFPMFTLAFDLLLGADGTLDKDFPAMTVYGVGRSGKTITLDEEFPGMTLVGSGTNNKVLTLDKEFSIFELNAYGEGYTERTV